MQSIIVEATKRDKLGKVNTKRFKKNGIIPAVVYGDGENYPISLNDKDFMKIFDNVGEHTLLTVNIEGSKKEVLIRDYQEHPVTRKIIHVDFYKINPNKKVKTHIPVHSTGLAVGVKMGGILEQYVHSLYIECLPKHIPHEIVIDVTKLKIKQGFYVRDLQLDENINILTTKDQAIFLVHVTRAFDAVTDEEEGEQSTEESSE